MPARVRGWDKGGVGRKVGEEDRLLLSTGYSRREEGKDSMWPTTGLVVRLRDWV